MAGTLNRSTDGNDLDAIEQALSSARAETKRPSLILVRTHLGYGSPNKQDTYEAHGSPLGEEEVRLTKLNLGWPTQADVLHPRRGTRRIFARRSSRVGRRRIRGTTSFAATRERFPRSRGAASESRAADLPGGWDEDIPVFPADAKGLATRVASGKVMNAIAPRLPGLIGGSADLDPSTYTALQGLGDFEPPGGTPAIDRGRRVAAGACRPQPVLQTLMYLMLSVAGHLTIFQTRTRGPFWSIRPARILLIAVFGTQTVATLIAVFGLFMTPLGWGWALFVWGYALSWFFVTDGVKLVAYRFLVPAKAEAKPEGKTEPKPDAKAEDKPDAKPNRSPNPRPHQRPKPKPRISRPPKSSRSPRPRPRPRINLTPKSNLSLMPRPRTSPRRKANPTLTQRPIPAPTPSPGPGPNLSPRHGPI